MPYSYRVCPVCSEVVRSARRLALHLCQEHVRLKRARFFCPWANCKRLSKTLRGMERHLMGHTDARKHVRSERERKKRVEAFEAFEKAGDKAAAKQVWDSGLEAAPGDPRLLDVIKRLAAAGERYDIVVADPPAFVKSKKDLAVGSRGYRKLARLSASLVSPGGFLFIASCSHNVERALFDEEVRRGLGDARRAGRILLSSGAAPDHPVHPALPESVYLKGSLIQLD